MPAWSKLELATFDLAPPGGRKWRIAHLSDLHVVGERYGFRIESGAENSQEFTVAQSLGDLAMLKRQL